MKTSLQLRSIFFFGLTIIIIGCGKSEPPAPTPQSNTGSESTIVKGKISCNGESVTKGYVVFMSENGEKGLAKIMPNGVFVGNKIPSGEMKACVLLSDDPRMLAAITGVRTNAKNVGKGFTPGMGMAGGGGPPKMGMAGGAPDMNKGGPPPGMNMGGGPPLAGMSGNRPTPRIPEGVKLPEDDKLPDHLKTKKESETKEMDPKIVKAIEKKYSSPDTSGLVFTINTGMNEFDIKLTTE
jgi:hypothetical protein